MYRALHAVMADYVESNRGPTVVLLQSQWAPARLAQSLPIINNFPVVALGFNADENKYPALDWQRQAVRNMLMQAAFKDDKLATLVQYARYGGVPLCNLPGDVPLFLADLTFSRQLIKRNHVLWISPSRRPDLGGREDDDNHTGAQELGDAYNLEVNNKGGSGAGCSVELSLKTLAVNTVLKSAHIHAAEGVTDDSGFEPQLLMDDHLAGVSAPGPAFSVFDETAACAAAFRVVKAMVQG